MSDLTVRLEGKELEEYIAKRFPKENTMKPHFPEVAHADHNITQDQLDWVNGHPEISKLPDGEFMIKVLEMPDFLEDAQCALYGPSVGDPAVENHETFLKIRGNRAGPSRMIDKPTRPARNLVVIGIKGKVAFTIYGTRSSQAAPMEAWDAERKELPHDEVKRCRDFWNQHALSSQE
tara:strand:+ start:261 stop:791 length:531 start_codon:yes stop_codon:yes gene_type:complete